MSTYYWTKILLILWCIIVFASPTDPTLTLNNATQWLMGIRDWGSFGAWIGIPSKVYQKIITTKDPTKALLEWYLTNHPAPSWRGFADTLYQIGEHEVLAQLGDRVQYLKGEPLNSFCCWMYTSHIVPPSMKLAIIVPSVHDPPPPPTLE